MNEDLIETRVKVRDTSYTNKEGTKVEQNTIKFNDLGVDQFVIVEKTSDRDVVEKQRQKKDGDFFTVRETYISYDGKDCKLNVSPKALESWNSMPVGGVKVIKRETTTEFEDKETKEMKKFTYNTYEFISVDKPKNPKVEACLAYYKANGCKPEDSVNFDGKQTTYKEVLGDLI